jgi:hypothetical protein
MAWDLVSAKQLALKLQAICPTGCESCIRVCRGTSKPFTGLLV